MPFIRPNLPADRTIVERVDQVATDWWMYFGNVARTLRNAVLGALSLTHAGRITKVTEAGFIGESRLSELEVLYMVSSVQADLSTLAATLTTADEGKLIEVTDYAHTLRWSGTAYEWGPGETGGGYVRAFLITPLSVGWALCDGSTVDYLKGDGTTGSVTTSDFVGSAAYLKYGASVTGVTAAVVPIMGLPSATVAATPVGGGAAGPTHNHIISLPGDPIANAGVFPYFRQ